MFGINMEVKMPLADGKVCNATLGPTIKEDIGKIRTYSFPDASPFLEELFPPGLPDDKNLPRWPFFTTGASASHFTELTNLVYNMSSAIQKYPESRLIIFDLGLKEYQVEKMMKICSCEVRQFPFDKYPEHVKEMKGYAWKPLIVQLVAKEHPFVIWMDASVRFTTTQLDAPFEKVRELGVMAAEGFAPIATRTSPKTFSFLGEQPCTFKETNEFEATFIMVYGNKLVSEFFLKPWVSCALSFGCLIPDSNFGKYRHCGRSREPVYFDCHRFDQSVLSILLYRLYHKDILQHQMKHSFFRFCKGVDEEWYLPQFINDIRIKYYEYCF